MALTLIQLKFSYVRPAIPTEAIPNQMPEMNTVRELQILQHTINGWDTKRIAVELSISVLTVRKYIANIYTKLHLTSKVQVISLAHKNNWV